MTQDDFLFILLQALSSKHGLLLRTNDTDKARQLFYKVRRESGEGALAELELSVVELPEGNLRIAKKSALAQQTEGAQSEQKAIR